VYACYRSYRVSHPPRMHPLVVTGLLQESRYRWRTEVHQREAPAACQIRSRHIVDRRLKPRTLDGRPSDNPIRINQNAGSSPASRSRRRGSLSFSAS
jgi:hypothetical protein